MRSEYIDIMTDRIVRDFDPLQIILFGSQARGDSDADSDVDMLVVFSELADKREKALDISRALADVPVAKDILVSTPEELERHRARIGSVLRYAQQEGKILCQKDGIGIELLSTVNPEGKDSMQERERLAETARWLRLGKEELGTAERLLGFPDTPPRQICGFAQQTAEKSLKAVLIFLEIDFRRTHDLEILRDMVPDTWNLQSRFPNLSELTRWSVESRYPDTSREATRENAAAAVEQACRLWTTLSAELVQHGYRPEGTL